VAYRRELDVLATMKRHVPSVPSGSTVLLANACPYEGPAVVFESDWDLTGALRLAYGDSTVSGNVLRSAAHVVEADGITTFLYGVRWHATYGSHLLLFDYANRQLVPLSDAEVAARALTALEPAPCPWGAEGVGVPII
jgi:hypothetical protein